MISGICWLPVLLGVGLVGWGLKGVRLRPWMYAKGQEIRRLSEELALLQSRPLQIRTVEKRVEVPVEKIVEKRVEIPVEKLVEVAVEKLVEKRIEVPIEKIVEKPVDRLVDNPAHLARIAALEEEVAVIQGLRDQIAQLRAAPPKTVEKIVEKRVEVPVEKIVEKRVEVPIEKIVEKPVERVVDNPAHLARIAALEEEMVVIQGLRDQIAQLQAAPPKMVEKIVEKRVEVPVEKIVEKRVEVPIEKIVEKPVERVVDNPMHLARIKALEREVAIIMGLRDQIVQLKAAPPTVVEKIVEKLVEVPVEKLVEKIVYRDRPHPAKGTRVAKAKVVRKTRRRSPDDLKRIFGVGPVLERFLNKKGVFWFRQVAKWKQGDIEKFERQLPSFAGRINRENWVRSAVEEHYKKYKKWLGAGSPAITMPETS